ncbi:MAG: hypothetical protein WCT18_04575, partial [Patescibacteria group bacterium]
TFLFNFAKMLFLWFFDNLKKWEVVMNIITINEQKLELSDGLDDFFYLYNKVGLPHALAFHWRRVPAPVKLALSEVELRKVQLIIEETEGASVALRAEFAFYLGVFCPEGNYEGHVYFGQFYRYIKARVLLLDDLSFASESFSVMEKCFKSYVKDDLRICAQCYFDLHFSSNGDFGVDHKLSDKLYSECENLICRHFLEISANVVFMGDLWKQCTGNQGNHYCADNKLGRTKWQVIIKRLMNTKSVEDCCYVFSCLVADGRGRISRDEPMGVFLKLIVSKKKQKKFLLSPKRYYQLRICLMHIKIKCLDFFWRVGC